MKRMVIGLFAIAAVVALAITVGQGQSAQSSSPIGHAQVATLVQPTAPDLVPTATLAKGGILHDAQIDAKTAAPTCGMGTSPGDAMTAKAVFIHYAYVQYLYASAGGHTIIPTSGAVSAFDLGSASQQQTASQLNSQLIGAGGHDDLTLPTVA